MNVSRQGGPAKDARPTTLDDFEIWLQSAFAAIEAKQSTPECAVDESLYEDVAGIVDDAAEFATFFGCPEIIGTRLTRTPIDGKRIVGRLLAWVRAKADAQCEHAVTELMSKAAVAKVLHVSQKTVDNERQRGNLPYVKIGAQVRFRRSDVRDYIEASMVK